MQIKFWSLSLLIAGQSVLNSNTAEARNETQAVGCISRPGQVCEFEKRDGRFNPPKGPPSRDNGHGNFQPPRQPNPPHPGHHRPDKGRPGYGRPDHGRPDHGRPPGHGYPHRPPPPPPHRPLPPPPPLLPPPPQAVEVRYPFQQAIYGEQVFDLNRLLDLRRYYGYRVLNITVNASPSRTYSGYLQVSSRGLFTGWHEVWDQRNLYYTIQPPWTTLVDYNSPINLHIRDAVIYEIVIRFAR